MCAYIYNIYIHGKYMGSVLDTYKQPSHSKILALDMVLVFFAIAPEPPPPHQIHVQRPPAPSMHRRLSSLSASGERLGGEERAKEELPTLHDLRRYVQLLATDAERGRMVLIGEKLGGLLAENLSRSPS